MSFEAVLTSTPSGSRVNFSQVLLNDGQHYDAATGEFRCPLKAKYFFSFVMVSELTSAECSAKMYKNTEILSDVVLKEETTTVYGMSTGMSITECEPGQAVYVETYLCTNGQLAPGKSRFSGVLLKYG